MKKDTRKNQEGKILKSRKKEKFKKIDQEREKEKERKKKEEKERKKERKKERTQNTFLPWLWGVKYGRWYQRAFTNPPIPLFIKRKKYDKTSLIGLHNQG